jgi:aminoglycoside 6-adenylyltransferase
MRSEREMFDLILETARQDERIRAVILNGSRANPNAPRDILQDFDIVYIVTDVASFKHDADWIERFGELMILQMPEDMQDPAPGDSEAYSYLMQFMDGSRIDLWIYPLASLDQMVEDSLSLLLLDKDGIIPPFAPASESSYFPQQPTAKAYDDCCNEFWWVCPYVAKGLWRKEILYAKSMLDQVVRAELMKMLTWQIGVQTGFARNPGKFGKYFRQYLEPEVWEMLLKTYTDAGYEPTWEALLLMGELFRMAALRVGDHFSFSYPHEDDRKVSAYLRYLRELPKEVPAADG